jgi:hypothetical protein
MNRIARAYPSLEKSLALARCRAPRRFGVRELAPALKPIQSGSKLPHSTEAFHAHYLAHAYEKSWLELPDPWMWPRLLHRRGQAAGAPDAHQITHQRDESHGHGT